MRHSSVPGVAAAVVTVSRDYGARGVEVARLVAERLGVRCWDREMVAEVAAHMHIDPSVLAVYDEHRIDGPELPTPTWPSRADYQVRLAAVAQIIASRGAAVLVGRGLGFLFAPDTCLRVRVICPIELRVAGLSARSKLSPETARAAIEYVDRERAAFVRDMHGRDVADPAGYDLLISTGQLSLAAAAELVVAAYWARFGAPRSRARGSIAPATREVKSSSLGADRRASSR